jgi:hypothetical protein
MQFNFRMKVGDRFRLLNRIKSDIPGCGWASGLYEVTRIGVSYGVRFDDTDPRNRTYLVQRIKKDGTPHGKSQGYRAVAFDQKFLETGLAVMV